MLDRFEGAILGLAIGDALGYPTEFMSLSAIKRACGPDGTTDFQRRPALYTDDTQMTLCIARALIEAGTGDLETLMAAVSREFVAWSTSKENNRAPGNTCMEGCFRLARGIHWRESGVAGSKGCGSAMRTAPVGLYYCDDEAKLFEVAQATSLATHGHPTALAAAAGTAYLTCLALRAEKPGTYVEKLARATEAIDGDFVQCVRKVPAAVAMDDEEEALETLGRGWTGEEAVALALYCFLRSPDDFRRTVLRGANTNGDSDSIACIAGAISGAYNGIDALPADWVRDVENTQMLRDVAGELFGGRRGA